MLILVWTNVAKGAVYEIMWKTLCMATLSLPLS